MQDRKASVMLCTVVDMDADLPARPAGPRRPKTLPRDVMLSRRNPNFNLNPPKMA